MPIHMKDLGEHINVSKTHKDSLNFHNYYYYFDKIIVLNLNLKS
jgi:hypothetical protein